VRNRIVGMIAVVLWASALMVGLRASTQAQPQKAGSADTLVVSVEPSHQRASLKVADLKGMARNTVTVHNPHSNADETYEGVELGGICWQSMARRWARICAGPRWQIMCWRPEQMGTG
jgi:hypothetical protein